MTTLANFVENFNLFLDKRKCTKDTTYIRSEISSEEEAFEFVKRFSETTGTKWENLHVRPPSPKYMFFKTWYCKPPQNREIDSTSPSNKCNAKIDVFLKYSAFSAKNDPYLNFNPPLSCVIRFVGKHNHNAVDDQSFQMIGLTAELKEKFFEYFHIGLSASEARMQHEAVIQSMRGESKNHNNVCNITSRQAQHLYNHWLNLKDSGEFSKEKTNSTVTFTFDELLKAIPKKLPETIRQAPIQPNTNFFAEDYNFELPLMFVCSEIVDDSESSEGHLLYNLKYGLEETFVTRLTVPPITLVRVEGHRKSWDNQSLKQHEPEVSIKLEPLDSDEEAESSMYACSDNSYNTPMKEENVSSLNLYLTHDGSGVGSWVFPLVFTSTGLTSPSSKYEGEAPLLFSLRYGPDRMYVTSMSTPNILAVEIPSSGQATLNVKDVGPSQQDILDSNVQVENIKTEVEDFSPTNSLDVTNEDGFPVILDVSSCNKRKRKLSNSSDTQNGYSSAEAASPLTTTDILTSTTSETTDDDDYQFLMSLLPDLKQVPLDQKEQVKKKMKDLVVASRQSSSGITFENARSNIYRDCGVLPTLRDWKF